MRNGVQKQTDVACVLLSVVFLGAECQQPGSELRGYYVSGHSTTQGGVEHKKTI